MSADYSFYTDTYHGSLIPEEDFPFWLGKADARLEELPYGRCFSEDLPAATQTRVSLAECAIADTLFSFDSASAAPIAAAAISEEKVGSHSVKYNDAISASQALASQIRSLASAYLLTTGLLNRACMIVD
jgi:hypothetical protein